MLLLHIGAFHLDVDSQQVTPWHRLTPRARVVCALLFVFATALTPNGRWWTWAVYAAGLCLLIAISRVTLSVLLRRVAIELAFVSLVLLGTLFRSDGDILWQWGWLRITTTGLVVLGSVTLKVLLSLMMLNLLVLTTSISALLHAIAALKMPPLLVAILASMYRYLGVLINEVTTMRRAAAARNLINQRQWYRLVIGNMIGALFIRTYERGDRVHQAMLSRGYTGLPPVLIAPGRGQLDGWAITATGALMLLGQAIYFTL
jgi:cobalt/nickel transport system permease protein